MVSRPLQSEAFEERECQQNFIFCTPRKEQNLCDANGLSECTADVKTTREPRFIPRVEQEWKL